MYHLSCNNKHRTRDAYKTLTSRPFSLHTDRGTEGKKDEQSPILYIYACYLLGGTGWDWVRISVAVPVAYLAMLSL